MRGIDIIIKIRIILLNDLNVHVVYITGTLIVREMLYPMHRYRLIVS